LWKIKACLCHACCGEWCHGLVKWGDLETGLQLHGIGLLGRQGGNSNLKQLYCRDSSESAVIYIFPAKPLVWSQSAPRRVKTCANLSSCLSCSPNVETAIAAASRAATVAAAWLGTLQPRRRVQ
jgi:hypothetical protein